MGYPCRPMSVRVMKKYVIDPVTGCWNWTGTISSTGYGRISRGPMGAGSTQAHRVTYELYVGEIPDGLEIDHLCRNRRCVNPAHLEAVTHAENMRRSDTLERGRATMQARFRALTHCKHGHPFDEQNTYWKPNGRRDCKTCKLATNRRWYARQHADIPRLPSGEQGWFGMAAETALEHGDALKRGRA